MTRKLIVTLAAVLIFSVLCTAQLNAGTDMIIDNSAQAPPPPVYVNAPPPPPVVYYAPRPATVIVAPTYAYRVRPARVYTYHGWRERRVHGPFHPWR